MNGENRRSREAVRNSVRTYGVKVMDPASLPLKKTNDRESQESVSRFSEKSLHSQYEIREGCCKSFLNRVPYATLVACILCLLGVVSFGIATQRGAVVTKIMVNDVWEDDSSKLGSYDLGFLLLEIITTVSAVMILVIGILATGDTRTEMYSDWRARVGGRVCCASLMVLTIVLFFVWLVCLWMFSTLVFVVIFSKYECDSYSESSEAKPCLNIPLAISNIFLSNGREIKVCDVATIKKYCKDYTEKAGAAYITAILANFIIIFSLVLFVICLAANYARIRCQAKFQELQELRHLQGDLHSSKDRF